MPLAFIPGDIFATHAQTLVNPVNCHGVMGKGLAREFAARYPAMLAAYQARCAAGELCPGVLDLHTGSLPWILNFSTKDHWRSPSRLPYIVAGLEAFVAHYASWGITSVAFPQLGCGFGGLAWSEVESLMRQWLARLPIPVEIYVGTDPSRPALRSSRRTESSRVDFQMPDTIEIVNYKGNVHTSRG